MENSGKQCSLFTALFTVHCSMFASRTTRTTPRNTRIGFRGFRTIHIRSPPKGGLLIGVVLKPLKPILVVLGVVLVVLEVVLGELPLLELPLQCRR